MIVSRSFIAVLLVCLASALLTPETPAFAQEQQANAKARKPAIQSDADARRIVRLVRGTFAAVHQANVSGNYAVFRDLAAPSLRSSMSLLDLANYFAPLREQNADLGRALMTLPKFPEKPVILREKFLVLKGYIPGEPRIAFNFTDQRVRGRWRFVNIAIKPVMAAAAAAAAPADRRAKPEAQMKEASAPPAPAQRPSAKPKTAQSTEKPDLGGSAAEQNLAQPPARTLRTTTIPKTASTEDVPGDDDWPMRLWYSLPLTGGR